MICSMAKRITATLVASEVVDEGNRDIYEYAGELALNMLASVLMGLAISTLFGRLAEGVAFMTAFIALRHYTGGYHADRHWKCVAASALLLSAALLLVSYVDVSRYQCIGIASPACAAIVILSPVGHKNKPLTMKTTKTFNWNVEWYSSIRKTHTRRIQFGISIPNKLWGYVLVQYKW